MSAFLDYWGKHAARPALIWVDRCGRHRLLPYSHFADRAARFAGLLNGLGLATGESVAVLLRPVPEWWEVAAGAMRAGVPFAPMPGGAPDGDRLRAAGAAVVVVDDAHLEPALALRRAGVVRYVVCVGGLPHAEAMNYRAMMFLAGTEPAPAPPDSPVLLAEDERYSHADLRRLADELGLAWLDRHRDDLHLSLTPRHTAAGVLLGMIEPWSAGAAILVDETDGDPTRIRGLLERFPVTTFSAPGSSYVDLDRTGLRGLRNSSLRRVLATGAQPDADAARAWFREKGLWIHPGPAPVEAPTTCATFPGAF
ncbi:AMP-binding protein [Amycolatopsis methanolica]|uniref:Butyrate--CoA ligase n=1 Tax=Amycolatopsis methanolica 239 TaxID=1068978 RepID=A0A076MRD0_AMYME|nr:AMP-binding protein [Amycolatopsis methanolica]AIJ23184.1 butyrate--CoA ligase [Amycolatopsis methanolica 239]